MKIKKLSLFFAAVLAVVCLAVVPASYKPVSAASSTADFVGGYDEYKADYIVKKVTAANGVTLAEKDGDGNTVKYYFDYAKADSSDYTEEAEVSSSSRVTFKYSPANGEKIAMKLRVFTKNGENADYSCMGGRNSLAFYVVSKENNANTISYVTDAAVLNAYNQAISEKLESKKLGDNFYYPDFEVEVSGAKKSLVVSDLYDTADLKKTVYYAKASSSSFTSTTSSYFKLSDVGTYKFYIVFEDYAKTSAFVDLTEKDSDGNALYERKTVSGVEGFYDKSNKLVVPVFTFTIENGKAPEVTVKTKSPNGYFGLKYEVESFTVVTVGSNEAKKYELYFSHNDLSQGLGDGFANAHALVKQQATDVTDDEDIAFDSSALTFIPKKEAGYYYVICSVSDENGSVTKVCAPIAVKEGFSVVKRAFDFGAFVKTNYLSIIFLSIALLSAIGIVLLIFVKPKDKTADENVDPVAKK